MLRSTHENADVSLFRFKKYIDETTFINQLLEEVMVGVHYGFKECFLIDKGGGGWSSFNIPADENCHIKAQYDYISYIIENDYTVYSQASKFPSSSRKLTDIIQDFISNAFKPLIDFINDAISKELMMLDENKKGSMTQNIGHLYGSAVQGTDFISISTTNFIENQKLHELLNKAIEALANIEVSDEIKADWQDNIEMIIEQIRSASPKKARINSALARIKQFTMEFGMKVGVSVAAQGITSFKWDELIQLIEKYIHKIA